MCYGTVYSCNVYCRNTDLNITSAMNETINGVLWQAGAPDNRCQVTACHLIDTLDSSGFSTTNPPPGMEVIPFPVLAAGLIVVIAGIFAFLYLIRKKE